LCRKHSSNLVNTARIEFGELLCPRWRGGESRSKYQKNGE
jgi:hypothetical protein